MMPDTRWQDVLSRSKVVCPLCQTHLDSLDQQHRERCAGENTLDLELMPTPRYAIQEELFQKFDIYLYLRNVWCLYCSEKLRLWPDCKESHKYIGGHMFMA